MAGVSGPRSSMAVALGKENRPPSDHAGQISSKAAPVGQEGPVKAVVAPAATRVTKTEAEVVESVCSKGEKAADAVAATGDGVEGASVAWKGKLRLEESDILWALSHKREDLHRSSCKHVADYIFRYQGWVRDEYEANGGYVDVDEKEHKLWMQNLFDEMVGHERLSNVPGLKISNCREDFYGEEGEEDESEEGEEDESEEEDEDETEEVGEEDEVAQIPITD